MGCGSPAAAHGVLRGRPGWGACRGRWPPAAPAAALRARAGLAAGAPALLRAGNLVPSHGRRDPPASGASSMTAFGESVTRTVTGPVAAVRPGRPGRAGPYRRPVSNRPALPELDGGAG